MGVLLPTPERMWLVKSEKSRKCFSLSCWEKERECWAWRFHRAKPSAMFGEKKQQWPNQKRNGFWPTPWTCEGTFVFFVVMRMNFFEACCTRIFAGILKPLTKSCISSWPRALLQKMIKDFLAFDLFDQRFENSWDIVPNTVESVYFFSLSPGGGMRTRFCGCVSLGGFWTSLWIIVTN